MKRWIGIGILLFVMGMTRAQVADFQQELTFGVNGGLTFSRVNFVPRFPQSLLLGGSGGLTVRYISEKHWGLQGELNYSQRGWKKEGDDTFTPFDTNYPNGFRRVDYIEMPVLTHLYWDIEKRARLIVNMGPQIGYNITKNKIRDTVLLTEGSEKKLTEQNFDYGITGGMGFELRTGIGSFVLEGRYYFGLSDLFGNGMEDCFQSSHNQIIGVKLTYLIKR